MVGVAPSKQSSVTFGASPRKVIEVRLTQELKGCRPMLVTLSGIVMRARQAAESTAAGRKFAADRTVGWR